MLIILPFLTWTLLFFLFKKTYSLRDSVLYALTAAAVLLTCITEILSFFNLLNFGWTAACWTLATAITALVLIRWRKEADSAEALNGEPLPSIVLIGTAVILVLTLVTALVAPPNNGDSLTYHMSRVVHWIQNGSVAHYPTHILRQLHMNPFSEYVITHFQLLSGGDRFANLVQWLSMAGSLVAVSLLARELGACRRGQVFASAFAVTVPMGILQATSTQNDYVASLWLTSFIYFSIRFLKKKDTITLVAMGASLGLGLLTKSTIYIYAFPFFIWFVIAAIRSLGANKAWRPLAVVAACVLLINIAYYLRNMEIYGSPLGPGREGATNPLKYTNDEFSPAQIISNVTRNVSIHLQTTYKGLNTGLTSGIELLHQKIGIGSNDPKTTWAGTEFAVVPLKYDENSDGNPIHFLIILFCAFMLFRSYREHRQLVIYFIALSCAFLLFCFILKWQPWNSRLHLPLFIAAAPICGVLLSKRLGGATAGLLMTLLLIMSMSWALNNIYRPILGEKSIFVTSREDQYFNGTFFLKDKYSRFAEEIRSSECRQIGLKTGINDWEYLFWVLLGKNEGDFRIEHVAVGNESSRLAFARPFEPCLVLTLRGYGKEAIEHVY